MNYTEQWKQQGYLIVRNAFKAERVAKLFETCESVLDQWKRESTKEGEPGGHCYGPKAWVLANLNHPKYHRQHPEGLPRLLDAVADPLVVRILGEIFREEAILMKANFYIDPPGEGWTGGWHRDCQFFHKDEEKERHAVAEEGDPPRELHMHIPLVKTASTEMVPGSHRRWDTAEELLVRRKAAQSDKMPGALRIELEPGDLAFFHVNSIHRGLYPQGVLRRTITASYSRAAQPRKATAELMKQWKGFVVTYQPWFLKTGYLDGCTAGAKEFFQRFIDVYRDSWKPEYLNDLHPRLQEYFTKY